MLKESVSLPYQAILLTNKKELTKNICVEIILSKKYLEKIYKLGWWGNDHKGIAGKDMVECRSWTDRRQNSHWVGQVGEGAQWLTLGLAEAKSLGFVIKVKSKCNGNWGVKNLDPEQSHSSW